MSTLHVSGAAFGDDAQFGPLLDGEKGRPIGSDVWSVQIEDECLPEWLKGVRTWAIVKSTERSKQTEAMRKASQRDFMDICGGLLWKFKQPLAPVAELKIYKHMKNNEAMFVTEGSFDHVDLRGLAQEFLDAFGSTIRLHITSSKNGEGKIWTKWSSESTEAVAALASRLRRTAPVAEESDNTVPVPPLKEGLVEDDDEEAHAPPGTTEAVLNEVKEKLPQSKKPIVVFLLLNKDEPHSEVVRTLQSRNIPMYVIRQKLPLEAPHVVLQPFFRAVHHPVYRAHPVRTFILHWDDVESCVRVVHVAGHDGSWYTGYMNAMCSV